MAITPRRLPQLAGYDSELLGGKAELPGGGGGAPKRPLGMAGGPPPASPIPQLTAMPPVDANDPMGVINPLNADAYLGIKPRRLGQLP